MSGLPSFLLFCYVAPSADGWPWRLECVSASQEAKSETNVVCHHLVDSSFVCSSIMVGEKIFHFTVKEKKLNS